MKNSTLMIVMGTLGTEWALWMVAPGLAAVIGVILGLFAIASWREGSRIRHSKATAQFGPEDFQRRLSVSAL
jgi:hypothetical protein